MFVNLAIDFKRSIIVNEVSNQELHLDLFITSLLLMLQDGGKFLTSLGLFLEEMRVKLRVPRDVLGGRSLDTRDKTLAIIIDFFLSRH